MTETTASTTTETPAATTATPAANTASTTPATTTTTPASEPATKLPKWVYDRIDSLTKQRNEANAEAERLRKEVAAKPAANGEGTTAAPALDPAEINKLVNRRAQEMLFERSASEMFSKGKSEFPDFEDTLQTYKTLGGMPPEMLEAALELGDGHKILYHLARDPAEAHRIMTLPPVSRIAAMAKYSGATVKAAGTVIPAANVSGAPGPVSSVVGNGTSTTIDLSNPNTSMKDWAAAREAQARERRKQRYGN